MNGIPTGRNQSGGRTRGLLPLVTALLVPVAAAISAATIVPTGAVQSSEPRQAKTHMVEIRQFKFVPATLHVRAGDIVVWRNVDAAPHTATSAKWDSGKLNRNQSWSMKVPAKGSFEYICSFHPMMKGKIISK